MGQAFAFCIYFSPAGETLGNLQLAAKVMDRVALKSASVSNLAGSCRISNVSLALVGIRTIRFAQKSNRGSTRSDLINTVASARWSRDVGFAGLTVSTVSAEE